VSRRRLAGRLAGLSPDFACCLRSPKTPPSPPSSSTSPTTPVYATRASRRLLEPRVSSDKGRGASGSSAQASSATRWPAQPSRSPTASAASCQAPRPLSSGECVWATAGRLGRRQAGRLAGLSPDFASLTGCLRSPKTPPFPPFSSTTRVSTRRQCRLALAAIRTSQRRGRLLRVLAKLGPVMQAMCIGV